MFINFPLAKVLFVFDKNRVMSDTELSDDDCVDLMPSVSAFRIAYVRKPPGSPIVLNTKVLTEDFEIEKRKISGTVGWWMGNTPYFLPSCQPETVNSNQVMFCRPFQILRDRSLAP